MQNSTIIAVYPVFRGLLLYAPGRQRRPGHTHIRTIVYHTHLMLSQRPLCHHRHQLYRFKRHFLLSIYLSCSIFLFHGTTTVSVPGLADPVSPCPQAPSSVARCARLREQSVVRSSTYSKPGSEPLLYYNKQGCTIDMPSREKMSWPDKTTADEVGS